MKMVKQVEEKAKTVETLVWEAQWRERDPTLGCYREFQRAVNENRELKNKLAMVLGSAGVNGWNSNNAVNGYNINNNNANSLILDYGGLDSIYFEDVVPSSAISFPLATAYPHAGRTSQGLHSSNIVNYNYSSQQGYLPGQQQESRDVKAMNDGANGYTPSLGA
ncbi:hypothetical protein Sjap_000389 [Stephania japonica]|uniref:LOB domain-containing protein n=1 Tax=Stephania japonica TaxID=461633 RepID=A0AAP0KK52_9MAGN